MENWSKTMKVEAFFQLPLYLVKIVQDFLINSPSIQSIDSQKAKIEERNCQIIIKDVQKAIEAGRSGVVSLADFTNEELENLSKKMGNEARFISLGEVKNLRPDDKGLVVNRRIIVDRIISYGLEKSCKVFIIPKEVMVLIGENSSDWVKAQNETRGITIISNAPRGKLVRESSFFLGYSGNGQITSTENS